LREGSWWQSRSIAQVSFWRWLAKTIGIDGDVTSVGSVKALKGRGRFDVLQVWGHVYKGNYRVRLIYASINRECLLMGQEILEASDPF